MEKIPSTLILHKKADGADTRFAQSRTPMSEAPLETWLGVLECGAYKQADNDPAWAFVKLDDMWSQEIEHDDSSDDSDDYNDDYNSSDSDDGNDDTATYPDEHDNSDDTSDDSDEDARNRGLDPRQPTRRNLTSVERRTLSRFHKQLEDSQDKLCFIEHHHGNNSKWRLVQVSLDSSDPHAAKQFGIYRVKFYTANRRDKETLPPCQCKFWPAIGISEHRQRDDVRPLHPAQVSERLRLNDNDYWAQADVHLAEILLYGPFDFETRRKFTGPRQKVSKETHFVAEVYWKQLEDAAQRRNVDISDIRRLPTVA